MRKNSMFGLSIETYSPTFNENTVKNSEETKTLQEEYNTSVLEKLEGVKRILNQIQPLNYRLEILENIYSLIYLSSNDLKDSDEQDKEDEGDYSDDDEFDNEKLNAVHKGDNLKLSSPVSNQNERTTRSSNISESFEILSTSLEANKSAAKSNASNSNFDVEFSIYGADKNNKQEKTSKRHSHSNSSNSSKRFYREYSSNGGNDENGDSGGDISVYRNNAGGGGSFLVNDFLCRDILLLVKDLVQAGFSSNQKMNKNVRFNRFKCLRRYLITSLFRS